MENGINFIRWTNDECENSKLQRIHTCEANRQSISLWQLHFLNFVLHHLHLPKLVVLLV